MRVRLDHFVGDHPGVGFNPRTRESATGLGLPIVQQMAVSIHALVRVRRQRCSELGQVHRFNPRTRESATLQAILL